MKYNIQDISDREVFNGFHGRFIHTDKSTLAFWEIDQDATIPTHAHFHEQVMQVLEGEFLLDVDGESHNLKPGDVLVIPPNAPHGGRAITACKVLDTFTPPREEYK